LFYCQILSLINIYKVYIYFLLIIQNEKIFILGKQNLNNEIQQLLFLNLQKGKKNLLKLGQIHLMKLLQQQKLVLI